VLAFVVWVGGMFFAYMVLRPSAGPLQSEARLQLWHRVFGRFFPYVWASVVVLIASGYGMMFLSFGGFAGAPLYVQVMQGIGILMMLLFLHLFFASWRRFGDAVKGQHFREAAKQLAKIRRVVATNLVLGLVTIVVGASGRFW
jgi:uncharacterized membrane protein